MYCGRSDRLTATRPRRSKAAAQGTNSWDYGLHIERKAPLLRITGCGMTLTCSHSDIFPIIAWPRKRSPSMPSGSTIGKRSPSRCAPRRSRRWPPVRLLGGGGELVEVLLQDRADIRKVPTGLLRISLGSPICEAIFCGNHACDGGPDSGCGADNWSCTSPSAGPRHGMMGRYRLGKPTTGRMANAKHG